MIKTLSAATMLIAFGTACAAECPLPRIEAALNAPLDKMKSLERDASDIQSTEGGRWSIYREKDGRVSTIIRADYGESGRGELRLGIVDRKIYGIAKTRIDYIRHAFLEGPFAIAKRTTEYYFYCDGKVYLPSPETAMVDLEQYGKDARAAQTTILEAGDIADFTKGLAR